MTENNRLLSKDEMSYINAGMPPEAKYGEVFAEIAKAQLAKVSPLIAKLEAEIDTKDVLIMQLRRERDYHIETISKDSKHIDAQDKEIRELKKVNKTFLLFRGTYCLVI